MCSGEKKTVLYTGTNYTNTAPYEIHSKCNTGLATSDIKSLSSGYEWTLWWIILLWIYILCMYYCIIGAFVCEIKIARQVIASQVIARPQVIQINPST